MKYLESERLAGNRYRRHKCEVCNSCVSHVCKVPVQQAFHVEGHPTTKKQILIY